MWNLFFEHGNVIARVFPLSMNNAYACQLPARTATNELLDSLRCLALIQSMEIQFRLDRKTAAAKLFQQRSIPLSGSALHIPDMTKPVGFSAAAQQLLKGVSRQECLLFAPSLFQALRPMRTASTVREGTSSTPKRTNLDHRLSKDLSIIQIFVESK